MPSPIRLSVVSVLIFIHGCFGGAAAELTTEQLDWARARTVRYACDPDHAPFSQVDRSGRPAGIDVEVLRGVAKETGLRFEHVNVGTWPEIWKALEKGEVDMVTGTSQTVAREGVAIFTRPYATPRVALITRRQEPYGWSLESLRGRRVAVPPAYVFGDDLRARAPEASVFTSLSTRDSFSMLVQHRADVAVCSVANAVALLPLKDFSQLRLSGFYDRPFPLRLAVRKDLRQLRDVLDVALEDLPETGHEASFAQWVDGQLQEIDHSRRTVGRNKWLMVATAVLASQVVTMVVVGGRSRSKRQRERESARRALAETQEALEEVGRRSDLLERAFDHLPEPVLVASEAGVVLEANPAATLIFRPASGRLRELPAALTDIVGRSLVAAAPVVWHQADGEGGDHFWRVTTRSMALKNTGEPAVLVLMEKMPPPGFAAA